MTTPHDPHDELREITEPYLRSFRDDVVPPNAKRKALMALGLGVATASSSTAMAAATLGGVGRAAAVAVVKSIAGGALAGAVVLGASVYVQERATVAPAVPPQVVAVPSVRSVVAPRSSDRLAETVTEPTPPEAESTPSAAPTEPRPSAPVPRVAWSSRPAGATAGTAREVSTDSGPAGAPTPRAASTSRASLLSREVLVLDGARAALAGGDALSARTILDGYDREFAAGNLRPEATVLRIEMLLREGNLPAAQSLAQQFERAHPSDSHVGRIRSMIASGRAAP